MSTITESLRGRRRAVIVAVASPVVLMLCTQFLFPGRDGARGTPAAILFTGLVFGALNALVATGLVLVYRGGRIVNFAQTAIGAAGASLCFQMVQYTRVPFVVCFLAGLVLAAGLGVAFDLIFGRRFAKAPRLVLTVLTIVAAGAIASTASQLVSLIPIFPPVERRSLDELIGSADLRSLLPFPGFEFQVGSLPLNFGFAEVFTLEVAVIVLLGLAAFLRYGRSGIAIRAAAENSERAALLGISVGVLGSLVWGIAGLFSGVSVTLTGFLTSPAAATGVAPEVLLPALAACVLARFRSLPVAVASAVGITVASRAALWSFPDDRALVDLGLFLVVALGLLLGQRESYRSDDPTQSWQASEEQRPIPRELLAISSVRLVRRILIGVALIAIAGYPFIASTGQTNLGGVIAINAMVALSLVVLTGWAGQVSLGQYGLVAIGAVVGGALTAGFGVPFWFAVPIAAIVTAACAGAIGVPALRLRGLFLAVTTFAFAIAAAGVLFDDRYFGWLLPDEAIERPRLLFLDFEDERSMYYLCLFAFVLTVIAVTNLRRTRFGRVLIGLRENEPNVRSFGVPALRTKLYAFAVSGGIAGFAGALFAHQQRGLSAESYGAAASIDVFLVAVIGGITSVTGALLGAAYFNVLDYLVSDPLIRSIASGFGTLAILYVAPGGFISIITSLRDSVLRIIAQRRQLVVPSLFADFDPEALEHKLVPLAEPIPRSGLAALPASLRFRTPSEIHGPGRRRTAVVTAKDDAAQALGATAKSLQELEEALPGGEG